MEENLATPGSQSAPTSPFLIPDNSRHKRIAEMWDDRLGLELPPTKRMRSQSRPQFPVGDDSDRDECDCCYMTYDSLVRTRCCSKHYCKGCANGMKKLNGYCSCGNADLFALSLMGYRVNSHQN